MQDKSPHPPALVVTLVFPFPGRNTTKSQTGTQSVVHGMDHLCKVSGGEGNEIDTQSTTGIDRLIDHLVAHEDHEAFGL